MTPRQPSPPLRVVRFNNDSPGAARWDDFVGHCWNANFLHSRKFLSYHGARFDDRSVFIEDESGKLLGLFPAAVQPDEKGAICSHPGATYGGIVHAGGLCGSAMKDAVDVLCAHYLDSGFEKIIYKPPPPIFHARAVADDLWALFGAGAELTRQDLGAAVELSRRGAMTKGRKWARTRARKMGVAARKLAAPKEDDIRRIALFIADVLRRQYNAAPTHSPEELILLSRLLGDAVGFWAGEKDGEMLCCAVVFVFARAVHTQYLASNDAGRDACALDAVIHAIMDDAASRNFAAVTLGASTGTHGRELNEGLHAFKVGFGGGTMTYERYALRLAPAKK